MSETPKPFDRFSLPGFTLPLNFKPKAPKWNKEGKGEGQDLFRNALDTEDMRGGWVSLRLAPLREFTMLRIMDQLTDKPNWQIKVFDDEIASKWKTEALEAPGQDVTQSMVDWCIEELRYKAEIFKKTGAVSVYDADVVKSDTAIPQDLKAALREAVRPLEDVPDRLKDWHPGSDDKVLDLVHPSLFPLVFGRSRILESKTTTLEDCVRRTGEGTIVPVPPDEDTDYSEAIQPWSQPWNRRRQKQTKPFSKQFQWLPCDVELSENGKDVKIVSYVNNLHPYDNEKLYGVLEKIIAQTIPLWNQTLTPMKARWLRWNRVPYTSVKYDPDPENDPHPDQPVQGEDEDEDEYWERHDDWVRATRKLVLPDAGSFTPPTTREHQKQEYFDEDGQLKPSKTVDIFRDYQHRGIQVIVKLANIHLTPEKPEYGGGSWHVEGQLNEHICASAIYYYDNENITTSHLAFRQQVSNEINIGYGQGDHEWLEEVFGCEQNGPCIQEIGAVVTSEGRLLTWPNVLQHQVQPFKLADPTKPGHRKILALFLVDPHIRIISTANVPCQRKDWWAGHIKKVTDAVSKLPLELQDTIYKDVDFPLTMEEAKELRLKLMDERSTYVDGMDEAFRRSTFSLCEH